MTGNIGDGGDCTGYPKNTKSRIVTNLVLPAEKGTLQRCRSGPRLLQKGRRLL